MNESEIEIKKLQKMLEIPQVDSKLLAAHIVVYRTLGIEKEFALACMEELARRRTLGEEFDYEIFIETEVAKIPKIDELENITNLSRQIKNINTFKGVIKK